MAALPTIHDIPAPLAERRQWVVWKYEARGAGEKPTKVPYQAERPSRKASSKAPHTWTTVQQALRAAERYGFDGVGYVFAADDPFVGFDFDDVLGADGEMAPWAGEWLGQLHTYVEVSPSGRGVKGIAVGQLPGSGINAGAVELYDQGRYFTITGQRLPDAPAEPQPVNGALDRLYQFAEARKVEHDQAREGQRQRAYAEAALRNEAERVRGAPEGTRNDTLNRAAFALAGYVASGLLDEQAVAEELARAAGANGLGVAEIRGTLRSGMSAGKQAPRQVPPPREEETTRGGQRVNVVTGEIVDAADVPATRPAEMKVALEPWTGDDLIAADIAPPRIFVPTLIRSGLSFFIGQPGVGKTPALVQLAIALSTGGKWLGVFPVPQMRVAYIGPEYDRGDIRNIVIASIGRDTKLPDLLIFTVENFVGPESEEAALGMIDDLVLRFGVQAIVIDLFTGFLPPEKFKPNAYRGDYREFLAYHRKALEHQIMICGAWHGTKRDTNPSTMYNGGQGFWGAAGGGRLVMFQDEEDQVRLYGQLRGNKAITYTMTESLVNGRHFWAVVEGDVQEPAFGSDVQRAIYRVLRQNAGSSLQPSIIHSIIKSDHPEVSTSLAYVRRACGILLKRGILVSIGNAYTLARAGDQNDRSDRSDRSVRSDRDDRDDRWSDEDGEGDHSDRLVIAPMIAPAGHQDAHAEEAITAITLFHDHAPSDRPSDRDEDFWFAVPPSRRTSLRLYLRSSRPQDEARARELCDEYALDFDEAQRRARSA